MKQGKQATVNLVVRAVILHEGHILLTTATPDNPNFPSHPCFLPGGHVEYNEPALDALKREIREEMGLEIHNPEFLGALECSWDRKGSIYHELNLVYRGGIENADLSRPPVPMDHQFHMFSWKKLADLDTLQLLPETLKPIIQRGTRENHRPEMLSQMIDHIG